MTVWRGNEHRGTGRSARAAYGLLILSALVPLKPPVRMIGSDSGVLLARVRRRSSISTYEVLRTLVLSREGMMCAAGRAANRTHDRGFCSAG